MEENLTKEKLNAKSSQEVYESKIKVSEDELQSKKKDNDNVSKLLKLKDTTIVDQNLKIFDFEKRWNESKEQIHKLKTETKHLNEINEHFKTESKNNNTNYAKDKAELLETLEAKTTKANKIERSLWETAQEVFQSFER